MKITKIEIKNLWGNDINWNLNNDVNILVGKNGSGKSTILRMLNEAISSKKDIELNYRIFDPIDEIIIELDNNNIIRANSEERKISGIENFSNINISYIDTFDTVEHSFDVSQTLLDNILVGKNGLKEKFILYQRNLSKSVENIFTHNGNNPDNGKFEKIERLYLAKNIFLKQINDFMSETDKTFDEENFNFIKKDISNPIEVTKLSSGEKQLLIILLTVLLQDQNPYILILDEPEISMHIDWQRKLIAEITVLNPNCQIVIATHSPTIFYKGWDNHFKRVEEISTPTDPSKQSSIVEQISKNQNKIDYIEQKFDNVSGNTKPAILYAYNNILKKLPSITYDESLKIIEILRQKENNADIFTYTTLISKVNSYDEAKKLITLMKKNKIEPNEYTFNNLLKKAPSINTGVGIIDEMKNNNIYPDITMFSTLIGKAKNADEIAFIEEYRKYYGIQPNEIYLNKLKIKQ